MYKMNALLKLIIFFLIIISITITNNYIILWLALVILTYYDIFKHNNIFHFVIDLILIVLLFLIKEVPIVISLFKIIYIIKITIMMLITINKDDITFFKSMFIKEGHSMNREDFYNTYFERKKEENIKKIEENYFNEDINYEIINSDLDRLYLESKLRFNGYNKSSNKYSINWAKIDSMILILSIIIFIIIFIMR